MKTDQDTLERIVPDGLEGTDPAGRAILQVHLERYEFAAGRVGRGRLLDIACGVGYGTRLLAQRCPGLSEAVGVDCSPEAIRYARARYGSERVRFRVADALGFTDPEGYEAIVSLETVEHLEHPGCFISRMARLLRPGGVLIASVPTTPSVDLNPHHRHDFTERSFRRLLAEHGLEEVDALRQVQTVPLTALICRSGSRFAEMRPNLLGYYARRPGALLRRLAATVRFGLSNRYLTLACRFRGDAPVTPP